MKRIILLSFIVMPLFMWAQQTLSPGDILPLYYNHGNNEIAWMPLVDIEAGTIIKFTDKGYDSTVPGLVSEESIVTYTAPTPIDAGTIMKWNGSSGSTGHSGSIGFYVKSYGGDQFIVFQGTESTPTFLYAMNNKNGDNNTGWFDPTMTLEGDSLYGESHLPPNLTTGDPAVYYYVTRRSDSGDASIYYSGATSSAPIATWRTRVGNPIGWSVRDNNTNITTTSYTITGSSISTAATGNWSSAATWTGGVLPASYNPIVIAAGHTLTVDQVAFSGDITINSTGVLDIDAALSADDLTLGDGTTLNVDATFYCENLTINSGSTLNAASTINCDVLTINSGATLNITSPITCNQLILNNGVTVDIEDFSPQDITINSGATLNAATTATSGDVIIQSGGTLNVTAALTAQAFTINTGATFTNSSTVTCTDLTLGDGITVSISGFDAQDITINSGATLNAATTASCGDVIVQSGGTLNVSAALTTQDLTINSGATFTNTSTITCTDLTLNDGITVDITRFTVQDLIINTGNTITFSENFNCTDLTIQSGSAATVSPGKALYVSGTLRNNAGASSLVIESDATGTGLLRNNTSGVSATIRQYITGGAVSSGNHFWHYMSVPLTGTPTVESLFLDEFVIKHTEASVSSSNNGWSKVATGSTIQAGLGYGVWATANTTIEYQGTLYNGDLRFDIDYLGSGTYRGFNFMGNPYPTTINWSDASMGPAVANAIYLYNPAENRYESYVDNVGTHGQTGLIPPMQGFFIKVTAAGSGLRFRNSMKRTNIISFKNADINPLLRIQVSTDERCDETIIRSKDAATNIFDAQFDAQKMVVEEEKTPQLYTLNDDFKFSINTLPDLNMDRVIPISVLTKEAKVHTFSMTEMLNINLEHVFIKNMTTGKVDDLTQGDVTFMGRENTIADFRIFFSLEADNATIENDKFVAFVQNRKVKVANLDSNSTVKLLTSNGRLVTQFVTSSTQIEFPVATAGVYIVQVINNGKITTQKVVVD